MDGGLITKPMVKEDSSMLMEMSMMDNGLMIKLMDKVFTAILMEPNIKVLGRKINNMVMVSRPGLMVLCSKANTF